jgi:RNA polymerase sigma factor (sigma-70 family)
VGDVRDAADHQRPSAGALSVAIVFDPETHDVLVRYAESLIGEDAAEDVVQNFYVRVLRGQVPAFNGHSTRLTWMLAIVKHTAYRWHRAEKKHPPATAINGDTAGRIVPQYELRLDRQKQLVEVGRALAKLSLADRRLLLSMVHVDSYQELWSARQRLAAQLGITPRTLSMRIYRARRQLKALLS